MPLAKDDQLAWHAFQYISGEMSTEESGQFEQQLEHNHSARETVSQMLELTQIVSRAEETEHRCQETSTGSTTAIAEVAKSETSDENTWVKPLSWMSYGAAACLFLMMSFQSFSRIQSTPTDTLSVAKTNSGKTEIALNQNHPVPIEATPETTNSQSLALAFLSESPVIEEEDQTGSVEESTTSAGEYSEDLANTEVEVPSWLMAAVSPEKPTSKED